MNESLRVGLKIRLGNISLDKLFSNRKNLLTRQIYIVKKAYGGVSCGEDSNTEHQVLTPIGGKHLQPVVDERGAENNWKMVTPQF